MKTKNGKPYKYKNGVPYEYGELRDNAKLTDEKVREIRKRRTAGDRVKDIAADMGVSRQTITGVLMGRTWIHVN